MNLEFGIDLSLTTSTQLLVNLLHLYIIMGIEKCNSQILCQTPFNTLPYMKPRHPFLIVVYRITGSSSWKEIILFLFLFYIVTILVKDIGFPSITQSFPLLLKIEGVSFKEN